MVGEVESLRLLLRDLDHADDAARAAIAVGGQRDHILEEVFGLLKCEVVPIKLVEVAPDEGRTGTGQCPITLLKESGLVDTVDLVALVGVPPGANHAGRERARVRVDDLSHDVRGGFNRGKAAKLVCLHVDVVADHFGDGLRVGRRARPLTVDSVVDRLKFVGNTIADVHILHTISQKKWLIEKRLGEVRLPHGGRCNSPLWAYLRWMSDCPLREGFHPCI